MRYFNKQTYYLIGLSLLLMFSIPLAYANEQESKISAEFSFLYNNKHIEEGANELPGSGVYIPEFVINFEEVHLGGVNIKDFYIGGEWVIGDSEHLTETNLFVGKVFEWENLSLDLSYTWINESSDEGDEDDHEFVAVASCDCIPWVTPEIEFVHSTVGDGNAVALGLSKELEMESFSIEPYGLAFFDFGYISEEYDGLNHIQVGLKFNVPINDVMSIKGHASHAFAEENLRREGLDDETWAGIGMQIDI